VKFLSKIHPTKRTLCRPFRRARTPAVALVFEAVAQQGGLPRMGDKFDPVGEVEGTLSESRIGSTSRRTMQRFSF
jgi:hypothetical protein